MDGPRFDGDELGLMVQLIADLDHRVYGDAGRALIFKCRTALDDGEVVFRVATR